MVSTDLSTSASIAVLLAGIPPSGIVLVVGRPSAPVGDVWVGELGNVFFSMEKSALRSSRLLIIIMSVFVGWDEGWAEGCWDLGWV